MTGSNSPLTYQASLHLIIPVNSVALSALFDEARYEEHLNVGSRRRWH